MRAFVAVDIPEDIKDKLLDASALLPEKGLLPVRRDALHITLHFLGELDDKGIGGAKEALKGLQARPMGISIAGVSYFNPDFIKIIFAKVADGAEALSGVYGYLSGEFSKRGIGVESRQYTPHVTLARVKYVEDRDSLLAAIRRLGGVEFGSFEARSVVLKESVLTQHGPEYSTLYELKL